MKVSQNTIPMSKRKNTDKTSVTIKYNVGSPGPRL